MNWSSKESPQYQAIVIGAGVCGIYQALHLKKMGLPATVIERADDVGGTWYWNRYPGCRFDSESETYGYSFSPEVLEEWNWSERFASRPETERYLQYVVEKFDLRKLMQFGCSVTSAVWDEQERLWRVGLSDDRLLTTRFLLTAIGLLSEPTLPRYPGVSRFKGLSFHTYHAPREPVEFRGKRVAVIGTGATGVQFIAEIADKVDSLTVFQRRPNWCAPLNNALISLEQMQEIRSRYSEIFKKCKSTAGGFVHDVDPRKALDVSPGEREAFWEELYASPGFGIWIGNFKDVLTDFAANAEMSKFVARKIRERVKDPRIAEKLIPKDHGFGTRRVPMETKYYEVYNRDNVTLVDISETPIECITETGIITSAQEHEFDIIVYATGFDAITGAFDKIDIRGVDGQRLKDKWKDGPIAAYGLAVNGFPNLLTLAGPQSGSVATNFPRGIEEAVDWCTDLLQYAYLHGVTRLEARRDTEEAWGVEVRKWAQRILFGSEQSWFTGYNSNVDRAPGIRYLIYAGGAPRFRKHVGGEATQGYPGFELR